MSRKTKQKQQKKLQLEPRGLDRTTKITIAGFVALVLVLAGVVTFLAVSGQSKVITPAQAPVGEKLPLEPGTHINPPQKGHWNTDPPTSGQHYNLGTGIAPITWGFHSEQVAPEYWVHNLEHGGIAILWNCPSGCADDIQKVKDFIAGAPQESDFHEVKLVGLSYQPASPTSPFAGHRFALVAWGWREFLDSWDSSKAEKFYEAHVDQGPEHIP
jgi:hypothetical protein